MGTSPLELVVRAMLLFAKQTAFRSHNYVYTKSGGMCRVRDVKFFPSGDPKRMIVTLPRTKTHQIDAPVCETRTLKCRCAENYCAVHAVFNLVKNRMNNKNEALFLLGNGFPVTYSILRKVLAYLCDYVGLDSRYYPPHSLRIGEATDRNMNGEPLEITMKFVNWKNRKSAMVYIRPDNEDFVLFE